MGDWDVVSVEEMNPWTPISEVPIGPEAADAERQRQSQNTMNKFRQEGFPYSDAKKAAVAGLPIVGDIAMTAFAPELKIAASAPMIARWGVKGANLISRMLASGAGSGGGSMAQDVINNKDVDYGRAGQEALLGAGAEFATPVAGAVIKKGAELGGNVLMNTTVAGKFVADKIRDGIIDRTTKRANKFVADIGLPVMPKDEVAKGTGKLIDAFKDTSAGYKDYNKIVNKMSKDGKLFNLKETSDHLKTVLGIDVVSATAKDRKALVAEFGYSPNSIQGKRILTILNEENVDPKAAKGLIDDIWKDYKKVQKMGDSGDIIANRTTLKEMLLKDLEKTSPKAFSAKARGDEVVRKVSEFLKENKIVESVTGNMKADIYKGTKYYEAMPGKTINKFFNNASVDQTLRIKTELLKKEGGAEAWAGMEFHWLNDLFESATYEKEGMKLLSPSKLAETIMEKEKAIKGLFGKGMWNKLKSEAEVYETASKEFAKRLKPEGLGSLARQGAAAGTLGYLMGPTIGVPVAEGLGAASAWALLAPPTQRKVIKLMKSKVPGIAKRATKAAVHVPLMLGNEEVGF